MTEVVIERLGHQGDGIAPGPVFVPRTLPGERIEGAVEGNRIEALRVLMPSPDRVKPICRHYRACGGCALQHASNAFVEKWKTNVVRTALAAQRIEVNPDGIETSPPRSRRRATLSARRMKTGALIGFHAPRSDTITPIPDCQLLHPDVLAGFSALEELVMVGGSRKGTLRLTVTLTQNGLDVAVTGGKPLDNMLETALAGVAGARGLARLSWDGELVALVEPPTQRFGKAEVAPPSGAFLQATVGAEAVLTREVQAGVGDAAKVVDLFSGSGTFSLPLAERADVHAVEGDAAMLQSLDRGWRNAQGLKRVTTEARDLFRQPLLPDELNRFDAIAIDPPRAGAEAQMDQIARSSVRRVSAVSCNPITFARDARILLNSGYALTRLIVVDQFRWSTHVELAAHFRR